MIIQMFDYYTIKHTFHISRLNPRPTCGLMFDKTNVLFMSSYVNGWLPAAARCPRS